MEGFFFERKWHMLALIILAGFLIASGLIMVAAAKQIVKRYGLDKKVVLEHETELDEEEIDEYKTLKATVNVKLCGMLVFLPGIILLLIALKKI